MSSMQDAITALQAVWSGISGIKQAPAQAPEAMGDFPFAVTYPRQGHFTLQSSAFQLEYPSLFSELHLPRVSLPDAIAAALGYHESFKDALLADITLGGVVHTIAPGAAQIDWIFGYLAWGGDKEAHLGFRYTIDVKLK